MKRFDYIYENGKHKWGAIARDPERPEALIDTNEYLVMYGDQALLTDSGGTEIFPEVFQALSSEFDPRKIRRCSLRIRIPTSSPRWRCGWNSIRP